MWDTTSRALELIARLEGRSPRSARTLADELGVTERTVRRDIARLRDLGYPIDTSRGPESGYSLEQGAVLPPILLTLDEAIVCTLALQNWRDSRDDLHSAAVLKKFQAALPRKVRLISDAVARSTTRWSPTELEQIAPFPVDPTAVGVLAGVCTRRRQLHIQYCGRGDRTSERTVEPHSIVHASRRWYLIAYDLVHEEWRTFRVDRITDQTETDVPSRKRELPDPDVEQWFTNQLAQGWRQVTATVRVHQPAAVARKWIAPAWGSVQSETSDKCLAHVGADTYDAIAAWLMLTEAELEIIDPPELAEAFHRLSDKAARAAASHRVGTATGNRHAER